MKTLIRNVNVFDGKHAALTEHANIAVTENIVTEIFTGDTSEEAFEQIIDGKGMYAIPGLTDAHVHLGRIMTPDSSLDYGIAVSVKMCEKLLLHGVTTVRDAGGITQGLKKAIDEGTLPGPRIYPSNAYISQTCGHGDSDKAHANRDIQYRITTHVALADGPAEVTRAVREQLYRGASQIKLMAGGGMSSVCDPVETLQFTEEEMKAAVQAAKDYGTYVMAHLYTPGCIQRAVRAGVMSLEHAHVIDEETAKMIADAGAFVMSGPQFTEREIQWNHMGKYSDYPALRYKKSKRGNHDIMGQIDSTTERIGKYNLNLIFGTDMMVMYPGYEPRANLDLTEFKKRFGSFRGLAAATGNIYDLIKLTTYQNPYPEGKIGVLTKGSYADILIVQGNPVEDLDILGNVDNIHLIMKDGKIYKNTIAVQQPN
ncbi:MAG: amidohydrolase family protein [bacterium]|nr:amidohydrolase family protein [bacterium]